MIICPNCQNNEMNGAIYCSKCGAQLFDPHLDAHKNQTTKTSKQIEPTAGQLPTTQAVPLQTSISLLIIESGQILPLTDLTEFTLGRSAEGQPIVPDVDLSSYHAYAKGVSRLHATIKMVNNQFVIVDLGSANGTYLNGVRLSPNIGMPVSHGDLINLGKLKIQILID